MGGNITASSWAGITMRCTGGLETGILVALISGAFGKVA